MVPKPWCLSLSGSGHLLVYQLGACRTLVENGIPIRSATGSSGGAIAATVLAKAPHAIDDFAQEFIRQRGKGLELLHDFLLEKSSSAKIAESAVMPEFGICTTICRTGEANVFTFSSTNQHENDFLLKCVKASCQIPPTFHPWDVFSKRKATYADEDGIWIDGEYHVDGGIAAPAPPTSEPRLIISPVSGKSQHSARISPVDATIALGQLSAPVDFTARMSLQNVQSFTASMGLASSPVLQDCYFAGQEDSHQFLEEIE